MTSFVTVNMKSAYFHFYFACNQVGKDKLFYSYALNRAYHGIASTIVEAIPWYAQLTTPTLADIVNQHDLEIDMYMYSRFILRANDDEIYELTMRRNANNNESQNPIQT